MRIILLEKIVNIGDKDKIVEVKSGYARNFLLPQKKAILASKKNIENLEKQSLQLKYKKDEIDFINKSRIEQINKLDNINIFSKVGNNGKLFGSIGVHHIINALAEIGIKVSRKEIHLPPEGVFRTIGNYNIIIKISNTASTNLKINILPKDNK